MVNSIFIEVYVQNIDLNIRLFTSAFDFKVIRNEGDFAELRLNNSVFILNAYASDVKGHFFYKKIDPNNNGIGTEIGFFIDNIEDAHKICQSFDGLKSVSSIVKQQWGMTDFRVVTMDNYYLRISTRN